MDSVRDLPTGYRWANAKETELILAGVEMNHIVVLRTRDSRGIPYTDGEADLAVPVTQDARY